MPDPRVPAKFEIGFPLGPEPAANLHEIIAAYYAAERVASVDISEADETWIVLLFRKVDRRSNCCHAGSRHNARPSCRAARGLTGGNRRGPHPHLKKRYRYERIRVKDLN